MILEIRTKSIKKSTVELNRLQQLPQTQDVVQESRSLENCIVVLLRKEEVFWFPRSRVNWMRDGDRNI
ncbi:hypothetical protein ACS0TY_029889 [Phlomoides rotata]